MDELKNKSKKGIGRGRGNRNNKESENEEVNSAKNKQQANQQLDISSEDDKRKRDGNNLYQRKIILLDISTKINRQMMSKERTARKHLQGRDLTPVKMKKNPKNQEVMQPIRKQMLVSMKTAQRKEIPTTT